MTWSAKQYSTFEHERTRPVRDLVAAIAQRDVRTAVDLGCGPGNSTQVLHERFPSASIVGLDSSEDMVAAARQRLPALSFEVADIGAWNAPAAGKPDIILANASLQWLPDHARLYPHLAAQLAPGGCLAIQTPDNLDEPAHRLAREVAGDARWSAQIGGVRHNLRHAASDYYAMLKPHCQQVDVWRTTYYHPLAGAAAVVEWFKGSALRPFLAPLDQVQQAAFLQRYHDEVASAYPALADGTLLLPFPRLFIVAKR